MLPIEGETRIEGVCVASTGLGRTGTWRRWAGGFAVAAAIGAWAQSAPTILLGEPVEVRPGETATLTIQAVGGPDEKVQLFATAESPPEWLAQGAWSAGPTATPRLAIEISPPAGAAPGVRELAVHATGGDGFTTQAVAVWRVLAPRCQGALEYDAEGVCRQCPPNHVPNAAKTACDACPPDTERDAGAEACTACPSGQTSSAGANCGCGGAARLTDAGCVVCPPNTDSRRNALNCNACPPGQHRPSGQASCAPCPVAASGAVCAAGAAGALSAAAPVAQRAKPTITITASETELVEAQEEHDLTVTVTFAQPAPAGTIILLDYACVSTAAWADFNIDTGERDRCTCKGSGCAADYRDFRLSQIVVPEGATSASLAGKMKVIPDHVDDDGEVLKISARNDGYDVTPAEITLREPKQPMIVIGDPASDKLFASSECGGAGRICLRETAGVVDLPLRIENRPPGVAYHDCELAVYGRGPNEATRRSGGNFNDYQLTGTALLRPSGQRRRVSLVLHDEGTERGDADADVESLTLYAKCGDSSDKQALWHLTLGFQPKVFWIKNDPWPKLRVERPSGGHVQGDDGVGGLDIDCGSGTRASCETAFPPGTKVELTALADDHHRFVAWREGGACTGTEPLCKLTMDGNRLVLPKFEPSSHVLTVERPENGYVTAQDIDCGSGTRADCEERYPARESVRLTATADPNHRLLNWTGVCSGAAATCDVTMSEARTVGAAFGPVQRRLLVSPPDGGRIAGEGIDCGGAVKTETCTVSMGKPETVSATFTPNTLTVKRPSYGYVTEGTNIDCGSGSSRTKCKRNYNHGETVTLTATGDTNFRRESWSGCKSDTSTSCQVEMKGAKEISATFEPDCPSGCVLTKCSGQDVCKCNGSTCPSGFAQQKNCSTTQAKQCIGDNRDCATLIRGRSCTTRQHAFSNTAQEYCFYETRDGAWLRCKHKKKVCFATITEIGCLPSAVAIAGTDPGPGGASDGEWSELALGYILSDFECGETPNSCTVTIGDEVETTTTHGVADKEDSLENWLWECHSDNGTVRECSLPKDSD